MFFSPGNIKFNFRQVLCILLVTPFFFPAVISAQKNEGNQKNLVYIDKEGILRYTSDKSEASFFGVNYTAPFAYSYRAHKALGVDLEKAIQNDVYHLARLGLDAFRVHVWDTEISDTSGNLLENEHLRLFDFLLYELKKRGIKTIITPIAFWGNGYPERDENTPGFSRYYGRGKLTTNDSAIKAQENYLNQFLKHINPYTKLNYEDDKDIIAIELNNEPAHSGPKQAITNYINRLVTVAKNTGWNKPLFYNISQGPYYSDAVAASTVDGFSFQWYPSGLVGGQVLKGNKLPLVDLYHIPFRDTVPAFEKKALMVYEFDAADVFDSYMYPVMAKAFKGAGFQWATQFAYDPMALAYANTEYQTHYLNLAYTPSKAISMLIASEVFHKVPRMKNYGAYPADSLFEAFHVSAAALLSEMNSPDKFYYSNSTTTKPGNTNSLTKIAGVGSSPVVNYSGTGVYFLDKVEEGVWRLEIMPDVIYIRDPFERASPKKEVTSIKWANNKMRILLDDLGNDFFIKGLNDGNKFSDTATNNEVQISPGTYLLTRNGKKISVIRNFIGVIGMKEFVAPPSSKTEIVVRHEPFTEVSAGKPFTLKAIISGIDTGRVSVQLNKLGGGLFRNIPMKKNGYEYTAEIPADVVTTGQLQYRIIAQEAGNYVTGPGNIKGNPFAWDNYQFDTYKTNIAAENSSLELYNPANDRTVYMLPNFRRGFQSSYNSGTNTGNIILKLSITDMQNDEVMGLQTFIGDKIKQRISEANSFDKIIILAKTTNAQPVNVKITLVDKNGSAFASSIVVANNFQYLELPLANLKPDSALLMPRPYPGFQPLYFKSSATNEIFNLANIEKMEITITPSLQPTNNKIYSFEIESVKLDKRK